ncbi:MAG: sugar ABC transporter ATP-binding protein [Nitriliruptoraceae bacterium]|nr:sugar ABC transporter ATP-binding protein [Nitriliruptoraceae bacterium]
MVTETPLLSVRNLRKAFGGETALAGIDFDLPRGEIRALEGENGSGKSTFIKLVSGVYTPDDGTIQFDGVPLEHVTPRTASEAGIQVIHQDLSLFPHLSVAENIAINRLMHGGSSIVSMSKMRQIAESQLERIGVDLPTDLRVSSISAANRQIVAICRAISMDAKLIFMDEPTTALTGKEVDGLLRIIGDLKAEGLSIVFISHKLDEVFKIADSLTVFRDGRKVGDYSVDEIDERELIVHMTGREVTYERYHRQSATDEPLLETRGLTRRGNYRDVNLRVRPGDIVGLTGLLGAGRTELALSLFGLNEPDGGEVLINGESVRIDAPWEAMKLGIALLPEDRHVQGLFETKPVRENVSATLFERILSSFRLVNRQDERELARDVVADMNVNNQDTSLPVGLLSGGNQQKVVIGKWIYRDPKIFILDSPTVGIDIGSKSEIYRRIHALAAAGMGVILISDEPDEITNNCNRVVVMHEGAVLNEFDEAELASPRFREELIALIDDPKHQMALDDDDLSDTVLGESPKEQAR